jgi:hypothetical protein
MQIVAIKEGNKSAVLRILLQFLRQYHRNIYTLSRAGGAKQEHSVRIKKR